MNMNGSTPDELSSLKKQYEQLHQYHDKLDDSIIEYKNYLDFIQQRSLEEDKRSQEADVDIIEKEVEVLRQELILVSNKNEVKKKAIETYLQGTQILKHYQSDRAFFSGFKEAGELDDKIDALIYQLKKSKMEEMEILKSLEEQKVKLKEKYILYESLKKENHNAKYQEKVLKIDKELTMMHQILVGLVLESKIDWYQDEELSKWVLDNDME